MRVERDEFTRRILELRPALYRVTYGLLAAESDREDAVQSAILKAWQKHGRLRDEGALSAWMMRIVINECYNILRAQRRVSVTDALPERAAPPDADAELHDALMALPDTLRLPVILHYMEGDRVDEVAHMLRLPQGTVKSRLRRARMQLRQQLDEEGGVAHA